MVIYSIACAGGEVIISDLFLHPDLQHWLKLIFKISNKYQLFYLDLWLIDQFLTFQYILILYFFSFAPMYAQVVESLQGVQ